MQEQSTGGLSQTIPATIFISYARGDEPSVLPIEQALQERGVRVLRDKPSLELGAHNPRTLSKMIGSECDAVLFYVSAKLLNSDFIWRYEIPTALARWQREPGFHIIPVLQEVEFDALALECANRGFPSLADFNAVRLQGKKPFHTEARMIALRTLRSALTLCLARTGIPEHALCLCLRTTAYTPPTSVLHLDLDWTKAFSGDGPSPNQWLRNLFPALTDVTQVLAELARPNLIDAWVKARLPAAIALGHAFPPKSSLRLRLRDEHTIWSCDGPGDDTTDLAIIRTQLTRVSQSAVIELAIARDVTPAVTTWCQRNDIVPRWRVRFAPAQGGASRNAITSGEQARAWGRAFGKEIRQLWDKENINEIHLFVASSAQFAVMLGQQLHDRRAVSVYYGDNEDSYHLAYTLPRKQL